MKPRTITQARNEGYYVSNVLYGNFGKNRVDMKPRFFSQGKYAIVSFWITYRGCKRLGINQY